MVDRGDYWQCAFEIVKGEFEPMKRNGLENFRQAITSVAPFTQDRVDAIKDWDQVKLLSVTVDRLRTWYRPGLICIGDAAHAMSPVGGVGINLAIQDAVAAANVLVPAFQKGTPTEADLIRIQERRDLPARMTQRFQVLIQDKVLIPYLHSKETMKMPWILRLFNWFPFLRWLPARFFGLGIRSEHVNY
jgi:2-polyprenyl-6-methoxyphenol hydroxylase-like FAD-dependent oxidoreductase